MDSFADLRNAFNDALGEGREDHRQATYDALDVLGEERSGQPRIQSMLANNPTITRARDNLGLSNPVYRQAREARGLGLAPTPGTRAAQMLGTVASDITQDRSRELWWLVNAIQAVTKEGQELLLKSQVPDIYRSEPALGPNGNMVGVPKTNFAYPAELGLTNIKGVPQKGVAIEKRGDRRVYTKRRNAPGHVDLLTGTIGPVGVATNAGIGLMNLTGGSEGYKAVFESDEDPSKTDNVIGEVAAKYILGRTGNLLNWDEFKQVRPDVSKEEYNRYKAFKYEKDGDMDLTDGDFTVPTGVLKGTMDGIHGPEIQFLGRSVPLTTGILPIAGAMAGTTIGARIGNKRAGPRGAIIGGLAGGFGSLAASATAGNALEQERRRRNAEENFGS